MKRLIAFLILVSVMVISLVGCGETKPTCFSGEWKVASIEKVELEPDLVYNAEANTMLITVNYVGFMVTLKLTR